MHVDIKLSADKELKVVVEKFKFMLQENLLMRDLIMEDNLSEGTQIKVGTHSAVIQLHSLSK